MQTMTFTFEIPDNCSPALVQQYANEFEQKINVLTSNPKEQKRQAIMQLIQKCAKLPTLDPRTPDEILGYTQSEMGLWGDE